MSTPRPIVTGLLPVAGQGLRLAPLPCSKELFPIGFRRDARTGELRPEVASHHVLEKFQRAGIGNAYVILRSGKWDIPAYFLDGEVAGLHLAYIVISDSAGPADTLDKAYCFVREHTIAFGFPDIQFGPDDVFTRLLDHLNARSADIVLGLYPAANVTAMDMVDIDESGRVRALVLKPRATELRYTWVCAVWQPAFTEFMHAFVVSDRVKSDRSAYGDIDAGGDLPIGLVIKAAVEHGIKAYALRFDRESYIDIGTPDDLAEVIRRSAALL
jgi:dTDP-glucose pyrophosphorylase